MSKKNILEQLSPSDAFAVLKQLAKEDKSIRVKIEQLAKEYLSEIDLDSIAEEVYSELDSLYVEDLWDSSGSTSNGYIEPHERAFEMVEETIEPFIDEMKKYRILSMFQEEKICCMGILKGLYRFEKEATSEFSDWATDAPGESFSYALSEWKENKQNAEDLKEMEEFVKENFEKWA
ncbi:MAG: hypothetical protein U9R42_14245 [Bacteroidota bacterium]|nr:hypothetical protein [Bacteroidota bacterium]